MKVPDAYFTNYLAGSAASSDMPDLSDKVKNPLDNLADYGKKIVIEGSY